MRHWRTPQWNHRRTENALPLDSTIYLNYISWDRRIKLVRVFFRVVNNYLNYISCRFCNMVSLGVSYLLS